MLKTFSLVVVLVALSCAPALAQQRGQGRGGNTGVSPSTIMDTPDVRVARVQIDAGAVRPSHSHNEGPFHMFIPITPCRGFLWSGGPGGEGNGGAGPGALFQVEHAPWIQEFGLDGDNLRRNFRE